MLARLDQLGDSKELAQVGAVVGREFSYELLRAVSNQDERTLDHHLDRLEASGLVLARGARPESTYRFKHALVQDAAYDSLLRPKRRALHHDVAQALEKLIPDSATTQPEMLAHHRSAAGEAERALEHWLQAGRRATEGSANPEAVAYLRHGLDELSALPAATSMSWPFSSLYVHHSPRLLDSYPMRLMKPTIGWKRFVMCSGHPNGLHQCSSVAG